MAKAKARAKASAAWLLGKPKSKAGASDPPPGRCCPLHGGSYQRVDDHHAHDGQADKKRITQPSFPLQDHNGNNSENKSNIDVSSPRKESHDEIPARPRGAVEVCENSPVPNRAPLAPDGLGKPPEHKERNQNSKEYYEQQTPLSQDELAGLRTRAIRAQGIARLVGCLN